MRLARVATALVAAAVLTGDVSPSPASAGEERPDRPHIVVILLDDVPYLDGRLWRYTPNIRRLFIDEGVRFTGMYGESPLCCPGRANWLTGQHTFNHGVHRNDVRLFDPSMTIATQLDGIGYHTVWTGKYLNGYPGIAPSVPPGWDHFHGMGGGYYDYTIWNDGDPAGETHGKRPSDYSTDVIGRKALEHIRSAPRDRSLASFVAFYSTHGPLLPAPRHANDARCATIPPWDPPNYNETNVLDKPAYVRSTPLRRQPAYDLVSRCRMMLSADQWIGAIREELRKQGRLSDTLFILTTDNGMNAGAHRLDGKQTPYATQVPFFLSWADGLGKGRRSIGARLSSIDLAPTLCDIAGCKLGPYPNGQPRPDGRSFYPLLLGRPGGPVARDALIEDLPVGGFGRIPPWYAVRTTARSPLAEVGCAAAAAGGCLWHYVEYDSGERELYDISNGPCWTWQPGEAGDPCELTNVAGRARYKSIQAALAQRLAKLKSEFGGR